MNFDHLRDIYNLYLVFRVLLLVKYMLNLGIQIPDRNFSRMLIEILMLISMILDAMIVSFDAIYLV